MNKILRQKKAYLVFFFLIVAVLLFFNIKKQADNGYCLGANDKFECYESYYAGIVSKNGVKAAVSELKSDYYSNNYIKSQCHQLIHTIGRTATKEYKNVSNAFAQGDFFCWSGYYHGVMEGILSYNKKLIPNEINTICRDIPGRQQYSFYYYNCVHGLGHGIMYIKNHELFESLEICNNLNGSYEQSSCWSGVFMENIIVDFKDHYTKYLKPEDPLYPCDTVDVKYKNTCYLMQTSHMLKVTAGNFSKVFELCSNVEKPYVDICYQSLGRDASGNSLSNPEMTKQTCTLGKSYRQQYNCVIGAVADFISYFHSDIQAKEFCSILPSNLQTICFETTEKYYRLF